MTKCKYYSDYDSDPHDSGVCHYDEYKYGGFPMICTHKDDEDNCTCFEPVKGQGLVFSPCEKIIFIQTKVGDSVELDPKKLSELDWININGIKFKKAK